MQVQKHKHVHAEMISPHCATLLPALKNVPSSFDKHPCGLLTQFQIFFDCKMAISVGLILIWVHYYKHWMYFWICIVCIRFLLSKITLQKDCLNPMEQARNLHSTVSSLMNCGDLEKNHEDIVRYKTGKKCLTVIIKRLSNNQAFPSILIYSKPLFFPPWRFERV